MKIPFECVRCSQMSTSVKRLRCLHYYSDKSRIVVTINPPPPVPADASTQTVDEDCKLLAPAREANTQTAENDLNLPTQIVGRHEHENDTENDCSLERKPLQDFNRNLHNSSASEDDFHKLFYDKCNPVANGDLLEAIKYPDAALKQRTDICENSQSNNMETTAISRQHLEGRKRRYPYRI